MGGQTIINVSADRRAEGDRVEAMLQNVRCRGRLMEEESRGDTQRSPGVKIGLLIL
jgi:hypothetical protein